MGNAIILLVQFNKTNRTFLSGIRQNRLDIMNSFPVVTIAQFVEMLNKDIFEISLLNLKRVIKFPRKHVDYIRENR